MENGDNYLHKKFKKQLSIEPRHKEVPNQSTNPKSSISTQSSNACISYVASTNTTPSFIDTTTSSINNINNVETAKAEDPELAKNSGGKYVCAYCNLVCSKPSVLQKHIRAHTNERPYPCNSCGFSFKTRSNLYKHCRSRTHANRVMGNRAHEINMDDSESKFEKTKPYKPRFHTHKKDTQVEESQSQVEENAQQADSDLLSHHINEIISKNNSIVNTGDVYLYKKRANDSVFVVDNNNDYHRSYSNITTTTTEEPLNLTNKNRKRCMSEVVEPVVQKSLIKELLLKNLNSDMQCPHCKMIFQTVTELELHKLRSCKGFVKPGAKYSRSSSVNVASILTQNKNAFDNIPYLHNTTFPLKSPGPFLGKTRLVESDKNKSFSFDDNLPTAFPIMANSTDRFLLNDREKKPVKLFGGEVKITHKTGETKSFKIDDKSDNNYNDSDYIELEYGAKLSENRVVKSSLQSGGTVLTNKTTYSKADNLGPPQDVIRVYENTSVSPSIDLAKTKFQFEKHDINELVASPSYKYTNIMDFSQKALKLLTPNLKQPNLAVPGIPAPTKFSFSTNLIDLEKPQNLAKPPNKIYNPMNLFVDGKVVRYVPGIPGPVAATEEPIDLGHGSNIIATNRPSIVKKPLPLSPLTKTIINFTEPTATKPTDTTNTNNLKTMELLEVKTDFPSADSNLKKSPTVKKFSRPNSLALKPTTASLKQHHGLTPTMFNQILISPDTPRVAKKFVQQFLHGNYFSYLGLKCSTKPVYCTLNKTQPFYVPHFKKLSMYSEWRQQDTKNDKLYVGAYDSRQRAHKYTVAGKATADLVVHSSYKFKVSDSPTNDEKSTDQQKPNHSILGGYECNEDYTYIRGRGRGRYVCDQCGIRCKKPSMLKKHIRTHSDDRPYICSHCNFSFKTKGNLTKHMKSKAHTKNYAASSSGSSTQQSGTQSSDSSDTEDSGMDSSDESTRPEEHEAAYGLLSLSQKTSPPFVREEPESDKSEPKCIKQFHVIQKYAPSIKSVSNSNCKSAIAEDRTRPLVHSKEVPTKVATTLNLQPPPILKINDAVFIESVNDVRKRKMSDDSFSKGKVVKNDEVMDLSMSTEKMNCAPDETASTIKKDSVITKNYNGNRDNSESPKSYNQALVEYDNSAMETLADIATKQVKLEKNTLAKSVASEFLKIATKNDEGAREPPKEVNQMIVKPEGSKNCHICAKSFSKPSQLRLHMNIHYIERPYRCHSCSVSFRTKGHLQKHERSASHHNKLSSSPALSSSEPRPFKCIDCNIAFRIHGHLAKHLRSKMHIMKLECLAKIPFGLYAELERSNSLLTEINTADGDQCLESLKTLAKKVFINEPNKLNQLHPVDNLDVDS